jgi:hypothetical protein
MSKDTPYINPLLDEYEAKMRRFNQLDLRIPHLRRGDYKWILRNLHIENSNQPDFGEGRSLTGRLAHDE